MRLRTTHGRLDRLLWCWKFQRWDHFFSEQRMRSKIVWQMTKCLVDICVVVYNVVVFSGEDIGGQMREMAIFGVPCWGLMVSGGVQGSNDRAGSYRGPTALVRACHPQHRQNLRSPRSRPLWQLEALSLLWWTQIWGTVILFLVSLQKANLKFEVESVWKLEFAPWHPIHHVKPWKLNSVTGSNLSERIVRSV